MKPLLWDRYIAWTADDIMGMKGVEQENRHLDFKLLSKPDFGRDDQRHLAKAISGFANAEGGVIVWGVDARRDPDDDFIDQVIATPGVKNPRQILAKLNGLSSEATSPGVSGLDHRIIEGDEGLPVFVATFVPEGTSGPYMAMLDEARHRYYRRIGSAFPPMDHTMVADMFGRRARPVLQIELKPQPSATALSVRAIVTNIGRGIARAPYLLLQADEPLGVNPVDRHWIPFVPLAAGWCSFAEDYNGVIHPGLSRAWNPLRSGHEPVTERQRTRSYTVAYRLGAAEIPEISGRFVLRFQPPEIVSHEIESRV